VSPAFLPTLNACLNAAAATFLVIGFVFIKQRRIRAHKLCMLTAFGISCVFLVSYLVHHARVGSVPFRGAESLRPLYFTILVPHVILAALVPPLALVTIRRGLKDERVRHTRIARITLPVWLYVSVSGVAVYWMLYRI
jgi:putative membrane protein